MSLKFGDICVPSKDFYSKYQVTDIFSIDLEKIVISEGIQLISMTYDIQLVIKKSLVKSFLFTLKHRKIVGHSNGVSRYNDNSPWKMGFDVSEESSMG